MSAPIVESRPRRQSSRNRGQSLVEFALILPVFLLVLAGILDFGMMLYSRMTLVNATGEGARWAAVQTDVTKIVNNSNVPPNGLKDPDGLIGVNRSELSWADLTTAPGSITVTCFRAAGGACDFGTTGATPDAVKGDSIRISTTYPYKSFFASFFGQTIKLGTQVQMVLVVPTP